MAGLWERVRGDVDDRVNIHLVIAGFRAVLVRELDPPKGANVAGVITALNVFLIAPLDTAAEADMQAIADQIALFATVELKLVYIQVLEYVFIGAELALFGENKWRSDLEI